MKRKKVFGWRVFGWIRTAFVFIFSLIIILIICSLPAILPISILGVLFALFLGAVFIGLAWSVYKSGFSDVILITMMSSGLLGFVAFVVAFKKPIPISVLQFWLLIEFGLIAFLIALSLFLLHDDYKRLVDNERRYSELESYLRRERLEERLEEKNRLIEAMSVSDLLALMDKLKSDESVVEIIDDILEGRE